MSRPVYTVLYSLLIIGLYLSLSLVYQSCGKNKKDAVSTENIADKVEGVADSYTEESFFEDDDAEESPPKNENEVVETPPKTEKPSSTPSNRITSSSTLVSGGFVVIAGNYLLENNADEMVKKLKSAGYSQAQKVVFDLSQYYTVIAGRYESRSVANSISSELNGKGIDNYVLRRKS